MQTRHSFPGAAVLMLATALPWPVPAQEEPTETRAVFELQNALRSSQRKYESLKSPLVSRVVDHRFTTKPAMYLANEEILSGNGFLEKALQYNLVPRNDMDFINITANESYWYSRYNLSWLLAKSRMGIHVVHGPYLTLKAMEREGRVFDNRSRGEQKVANRQVLLDEIIPIYLDRTGFPRRFEDASPIMLEYASGDPYLPRAVDTNDDFEGQVNGKVDYEDSYLTLRWDHAKMDKSIDMGGVGQTLVKQTLWMEYFFRQNHLDGKLLGNDAEDGFRGCMLNLMAVSKMLLLKSALFYDGKKFQGVDPFSYDPGAEILYIPHIIKPRLIMAGDIPPRAEWYTAKDASSQLFDQASLLWGTSEFFHFSDPRVPDNYDNIFGDNFPYDGSVMEQKWNALAHGLSDVLVKNILSMHRDPATGLLASVWTPGGSVGSRITLQDAGMAMIGLANYIHNISMTPDLHDQAAKLLETEAKFLLTIQSEDGSFPEAFDMRTQAPLGERHLLLAQGFAVRGLLRAYEELGDDAFLLAAGRSIDFMNTRLWDEETGVYRSTADAALTTYTPMNLGAALGALREWILVARDTSQIPRYKRFHVQGLNRGGILLAEEAETGEIDISASSHDSDADGLQWFGKAGKNGRPVAAVHASRVEIETPEVAPRVARDTSEPRP
ncbi:MAG: hypothetical protein ACE5HD_06130 [Acidobacteriota bacterium]